MTRKRDKLLLPQVEKAISAAATRRIERASEGARRSRAFRGSRRTLVVLLASLALTGTALAAVTGWNTEKDHEDARQLAETHRCGAFASRIGHRVIIYGSPELRCETARAVIEAFWGPSQGTAHHGGSSTAESWYTLELFPGWRCYQAAGAGNCNHANGLVAMYEMPLPGRLAQSQAGNARESKGPTPVMVSARGAGEVRLGMTAGELRERDLIGPFGPNCKLRPAERTAWLRPPLSGVAIFPNKTRLKMQAKLSSLVITGGAETAEYIGVGSTPKEALRAYPEAVYEPGRGDATGHIWVGGRSNPQLTFLLEPKAAGMYRLEPGAPPGISKIVVPAPRTCEK